MLISGKKEDAEFAEEVALATQLTLKAVPSPIQGAKILAAEDVSIILADVSSQEQYTAFETAVHESVGLFSDKINSNAIHFVSSEDLGAVSYLIQSPLFGHLVRRDSERPRVSGKHYGRIVKATLSERSFGLGRLLKPECKIQTIKLAVSSQKQDAVEAVRAYLIAAKFQSRMAAVIANAVDELVMNAIYDAPVDELGKQLLAATSRATVLKLEGKSSVELHVGFDGDYAAISAVDLYGSLDKTKLLNYISRIYTQEEYKVKTNVAGAGIGLATVFRSGGSFFFVSESGVQTEVTVFFKRTDNFKEFRDQFRFISTQFYF